LAGLAVLVVCPTITLAYLSGGVGELTSASAIAPAMSEQAIGWSAWLAEMIRPHSIWITAFWFAGVGCLSLRFVCGVWGLHRVRAHVQTVPSELLEQARGIAERLGVRAAWSLQTSASAREPMTFGWLRPVILLPVSLLTAQPPAILEAVLAHELAHIRRHDLWINAMQRIVESIFFFHPVVWWMSRRVREEREICCDDIAVQLTGEPLVYATALERIASHRIEWQVSPFAVAMSGGSLRYRVRRALGLAEPVAASSAPSPRVLLIAVLLCGTFALTSSGGSQWIGRQLSSDAVDEARVSDSVADAARVQESMESNRSEPPKVDRPTVAPARYSTPASAPVAAAVEVKVLSEPQTEEEEHAESFGKKSALASFDTNGDRTLDAAERKAIEKAYATTMKNRSRQMMEIYDTNRDGSLDLREKAAVWSKYRRSVHSRRSGRHPAQHDRPRPPHPPHARPPSGQRPHHGRPSRGHGPSDWKRQITKKYDVNGDGSLDKQERSTMYAAWKQRRTQHWRAFMERYDIDGNGHIDQHERMAIHLARAKASKTDRKYPEST